jgi:hypothetical protein
MDRNKDNDLTRQEFPGTDEQFQQLDADKDELVSADEALDFERLTSPPSTEESPTASGGTDAKASSSIEPPADNDN